MRPPTPRGPAIAAAVAVLCVALIVLGCLVLANTTPPVEQDGNAHYPSP